MKIANKKKRNIIISESEEDDEKKNENDGDKMPSVSRLGSSGDSKRPKLFNNNDICPICLCSLSSFKYHAYPDSCEHVYCIDCLEEWSKVR